MECLSAIATGIVSKIGEMLVEPISAQLGSFICYDTNVNNLKDELRELEGKKQALQGKVDAERRNGREIAQHVTDWLDEVAKIEKTLEKFYKDDEDNRNKLGGWCPNLHARYSMSRRARKATAKLANLKLKQEKLEPISYPGPPLKLESIFTEGIKSFKSRESIVREILEKLKDDRITKISICGMGGVGKTTLVKEVIKIVQEVKLFDYVVMTAVSQTPNYWKIQVEIAERLGLTLDKESQQVRADQLLGGINKSKSILIVLDDVWTDLDFQSIGLPSSEEHKACKVIFTSRDEGTCQKMGSQQTFKVDPLSEEDSWDLFQDISRGESGDVVNNSDIQPIAEEIVDHCGGLPIAIVTVAKALTGSKAKFEWEDARNQLRKSSASFSEVQKCIELSCNLLDKEQAKHFLFLCCFFPEDADIPIEDLLRQGWGLGFFKDRDALWEARSQVHTLMTNLKKRYLLLDSDMEECVKMHDVVRDAIKSIAAIEEHGSTIQCDAEKKGHERTWSFSNAVSITTTEGKEWPNIMDYPKLELLQMTLEEERKPIPIDLLQGMSKLKVLYLQNLWIPNVSSLFPTLNNLQTLRLEGCHVRDISIIGKELLKLEILSFAYSNIEELPEITGQLRFLRLLDLTGCDDLDKFSYNVLKRLSQLEEFYFRVKNFPWMRNNAILPELKEISHQLKVLELRVRKVETLPKDLIFENLERFWVYLVPYDNFHRRGYLESNILQLTAIDFNFIKCNMLTKQLVKKCEILIIQKVKNLKNVIGALDDGELPCLKDLNVSGCSNLQYLVDDTRVPKSVAPCPNLVKVVLIDLPNLKGFSKAINLEEPHQPMPQLQAPNCSTQSVESMKAVDGHPSSSISAKLFSSNDWIQQFQKLETILLDGCTSLEMLFDLQGYSEVDGQPHTVLFPQLKKIKITDLEKLSYVWSNVPHCVQGFQNLRSLVISECHSLKHVFTLAIVRAITKLEKLEIGDCDLMENLVAEERDDEDDICEDKGKVETIVFDKLDSLTLARLPMLGSMCADSNYELEWPSLRDLNIDDCPKLKTSFWVTQSHDVPGFSSFKEKSLRSSNWHLRCMPLPNFFLRDNKNLTSSQATSSTGDHISSISGMKKEIEIGHLQSLVLRDLPNLVNFCLSEACTLKGKQVEEGACEGEQSSIRGNPLIDGFLFPNLTSLTIYNCDKISILFSPSSSASLQSLRVLEVQGCENIEEIVSRDESQASLNKITFLGLQKLVLSNLPNLKAFCQGSYNFDFPSLREVKIEDCPDMEVFSQGPSQTPKFVDVTVEIESCIIHIEEMGGPNSIIQGFKAFVALQTPKVLRWSELRKEGIFGYHTRQSEITIREFHTLSTIISFNQMHLLQHLKQLNISSCDSLVEVFDSEGEADDANKGNVTMHETLDYELEGMDLSDLPKVRHIWNHKITRLVSFQKLTTLYISGCHSLKSVLSHSMARSLVQLQRLTVRECNMMDEIVTKEDDHTEGGSRVKILFPKLKESNLSDLPKLECFCSGDYDYDLSLCDDDDTIVADQEKEMNKFEISFPELEILDLDGVPNLKCFCSGAYDYDLFPSSSEELIEECQQITTFPHGTVIVSTPKLQSAYVEYGNPIHPQGDLNLAIHYAQNSEKYNVVFSFLNSL